MTSKVSNNNFSPVLHNWKCNVRSSKKTAIISTILHMLAAPVVFLAMIISIYTAGDIDGAEVYAVIGVITTCIAGFMGIIIAVDSFKCLYKRSVVDMRLSLPLTADQRFVSNFLSGLFTYIVPFLTAQVFSLLFAGYGLLFMEGRTFYHTGYDYATKERILVPYVCDVFSEAMPMLLKLILCGILVMLMLYTLSVLVTVCCGSQFESIGYAIIINAVIPLTILMITLSMFNDIYGVDPAKNAVQVFMVTSPAGGIYTAFEWVTGELFSDMAMNHIVWVALFFLVTVIFGALAFFLYRKRRAEQVSKPFVFKLLYYIIITGGIFCIFSACYIADVSIIPTVIITAVAYMILEVITNRGFKRFWFSGIKYIATMLAAFLIIFVSQKTDGFGALWRVPSEITVSSVEIYYPGFYGDFSGVAGRDSVTLTDKENIKAIIAAHKEVLAEYKEYTSGTSDYYDPASGRYYTTEKYTRGASLNGSLTIKYHLAGGRILEREYYSHFSPNVADILSGIDLTEEYKTQIADRYRTKIKGWSEEYSKLIEYDRSNNQTGYLSNNVKLSYELASYAVKNHDEGISMYYLYNHNFFDQLADAYANDIMAINEDNYYHSELADNYSLDFTGFYYGLSVPGSFKNTLDLLSAFDFNIPKMENISNYDLYVKMLHSQVCLFSEDEWREMTGIDENDAPHARYTNRVYIDIFPNIDKSRAFVYNYNEDLFDILRHAQPRNIVGKNCYTINVSGLSYVIPAEFQDAAERVAAGRTLYSEEKSKQYSEELEQLQRIANGVGAEYYY